MWNDILGQELPKRILRAHLASEEIPHAYLLAGPAGVGKARLARVMAQALNCTSLEERPCGACIFCQQIMKEVHPDVHVLQGTGASDQIKIEQIRQLISRLSLRPYSARFQVAILEEADRLTEEASNSLLKVLEEPPVHTRFILTTSHFVHCLPTVVSRCQIVFCQPLGQATIAEIVAKEAPLRAAEAHWVASLSMGSASKAIALAKHWDSYLLNVGRLTDGRLPVWLKDIPETRDEVKELLEAMLNWLRDVSIAASTERIPLLHAGHAKALKWQARKADVDRCLEAVWELVNLHESLAQFVSPRLVATMARETWLSLGVASG